MEKNALLRALMKLDPALIRKFVIGRPKIELFKKMSPIAKAQLAAGRRVLESEAGTYRKLIEMGLRKGVKDKALIGAALGSALGAGSLGWSLAKENPETDSRLAKLLVELLFLPEDGMKSDKPQESQPPRETPSQPMMESYSYPMSDLFSQSGMIDWGSDV